MRILTFTVLPFVLQLALFLEYFIYQITDIEKQP